MIRGVVFLCGVALVAAGVALFDWRAALVTTGLLVILDVWRPSPPRERQA